MVVRSSDGERRGGWGEVFVRSRPRCWGGLGGGDLKVSWVYGVSRAWNNLEGYVKPR